MSRPITKRALDALMRHRGWIPTNDGWDEPGGSASVRFTDGITLVTYHNSRDAMGVDETVAGARTMDELSLALAVVPFEIPVGTRSGGDPFADIP